MTQPTGESLDVEVDLSYLTVGEIEQIEERSGMSIDALNQADIYKGKILRAVGYVMKKRDNPDFTWEDAGNLRIEFTGKSIPPTVSTNSSPLPQLPSFTDNLLPK